MRQSSRRPGLALQPFPALVVLRKFRCERLDRHMSTEPGIFGQINHTHAALAEHPDHDVLTQTSSDERVAGIGTWPLRFGFVRRSLHEAPHLFVRHDERLDFSAQRGVPGARLVEEGGAAVGILLDGCEEQLVESLPAVRVHWMFSWTARA